MARAPRSFTRLELLRRLPWHVFWAALSGAVCGFALYWGGYFPMPGWLRFIVEIPLGAGFAVAATLPLAIPGRHWSLAFISATMMLMVLVIALLLSGKIQFLHSLQPDGRALWRVNLMTCVGLLTGGCLGLFYGLLAGHKWSLIVGAALGAAAGYTLGLLSVFVISQVPATAGAWLYDGAPHFTWQGSAALALLHLGASVGALMGASGGLRQGKSKPQTGAGR
jgi:hypothetical protein